MRIAHIFAHSATNTGDIYLKKATQLSFLTVFPQAKFSEIEIRKIFTHDDLIDLNSHDCIVIGGGGLLLKDTFPNDVSDWQWGCSVDILQSIKVPIIVYAIGYNRFRQQEDFNRKIFNYHIETLIKKSLFFSVRNTGSQCQLRRYVPDKLGKQIELNFCPSLLLPHVIVDRKTDKKKVGLLLAGDRLHLRHSNLTEFVAKIRSLLKELSAYCNIYLVGHQPNDFWYIESLTDIPYQKVELIRQPPEEVIAFYKGLDVMIGDRGHAQMIPFALSCKIVSLISHDKLKWFLEDIGLNEYGVEESDENLKERVLSLIFPSDKDSYADRRIQALRKISVVNNSNLEIIHEKLVSAL